MTRRKRDGLLAWIETGSLTAAAAAAKIDRRNATCYFKTVEVYEMMQRCLLKEGVGPAQIAGVVSRMMRATKFINDTAADIALKYAKDSRKGQLYFFDPVTNQPRQSSFGVVADMRTQKDGAELAAKLLRLLDDPEYGKRMFEQGQEAAGQHYLALIEALQGYLTPEGQRVLAERVAAMGESGKK
jgi:hypothetical protein